MMEIKLMLKFISNKNGIMGLTLSQIGIFIASGILISAVFSFIYLSDFKKKAEIENISNSFSNFIEAMDSKFFENRTKFFFNDYNFDYSIYISSEYTIVESDGNWNNILSSKKNFLIKPLIRAFDPTWQSFDEMHFYLYHNFNFSGNKSDPIGKDKIEDVKSYFELEKNNAYFVFSESPFEIDLFKPVFVEKAYIFYDTNGNGLWEKNIDEKEGMILIYQR